ncbi:MAG: hypothetical protein P4L59_15245 [Desulfosporosinus sp.]|nr:hypothetical protein [Desulfosporosinus sp.]
MALIFSLIISSVGFAYFVYGKKTVEFLFLIFGLALMIYPYFIPDLVTSVIIGVLLVIAPFVLKTVI